MPFGRRVPENTFDDQTATPVSGLGCQESRQSQGKWTSPRSPRVISLGASRITRHMDSRLRLLRLTATGVTPNTWAQVFVIALCCPIAWSQDVSMPSCASNPPTPSYVVTVRGFPAERLYIHPTHPGLCSRADDTRCKPNAYVISGDRLTVSESCANWSFVSFSGKTKVAGWVATGHLPRIDLPVGTEAEPQFAEAVSKSANPACLEAETILNQQLLTGHGDLPSALANTESLSELPAGVGPGGQTWSGSESDVQIHGHALKALGYGSGGTCNDNSMELWTPDFKNRITVAGSNVDGADDGGYSSETVVKLAGQPYFAHMTRSARTVTLIGLHKDLSSNAICHVTELPTRREVIKSATDSAVCDAVLANHVEGAPMDDIEPFDLSPEALQLGDGSVDRFSNTRGPLRVISRGRIDIENNGSLQDVAMLDFENGVDTAGCGHDVDTRVPIILNADGMPSPKSTFNSKIFEDAGAGEDTRLFRFHGSSYYETRSHLDADGEITHRVWKFTTSGRVKICEFIPVQYRANDVH